MQDSNYIVISLGGSLIVPDDVDTKFLDAFRALVRDYAAKGFRFVLIAGGGRVCRRYQDALKTLSSPDNDTLDWLGIHTTRLNAQFVRLAFGDLAHDEIVIDPYQVPKTDKPVIVGAGWKPGWSTDYDAVVIAGQVGAGRVANLSNIDYAYTKDPRKFADATPIKSASWAEFRALLPEEWDPGLNAPFDPIAAKEAEALGLEVAIMNGGNIDNFKTYLDGGEFIGTTIK